MTVNLKHEMDGGSVQVQGKPVMGSSLSVLSILSMSCLYMLVIMIENIHAC